MRKIAILSVVAAVALAGCDGKKTDETDKQKRHEASALFPVWIKAESGYKWGFIDVTGRLVIEPRFDYAWQFGDDVAKVKVNGKRGYIDKTGKYIWKPTK